MDLIYQNADRVDQGVMKNYEMDLAYGKDENSFTLTIDLDEHCLEEGYILYMEGSEYGGIVDKIEASNINDRICYLGRTWHGILEGKIFEPIGNNDYLLLSGEAHEVLREQIEIWGLTDLFAVSEEQSSVTIANYKIRYAKGYTGIRQMLFEAGGKLMMEYKNDRVVLSAEPYIDYSQDEEFDSSQVYFTCKKDYRPLNHLLCIGLGEANELYTIHLFCNEYKGLQAYATKDVPIMDSDYILTKQNQKLFGKDEVAEMLDMGSVQAVKNYVLLNAMPTDWNIDADTWNERFADIYTLDEESKFKQIKAEKKKVYELQTIAPSDWNEKFKSYFIQNGVDDEGNVVYEHPEFESYYVYTLQTVKPNDWTSNYYAYYTKYETYDNGAYVTKYREVKEAVAEDYVLQKQIPNDWDKNYGNYYVDTSDGVINSYGRVSGVTQKIYIQQTEPPSDWNTNYQKYFKKSRFTGEYVQQEPRYEQETKKPKNWNTKYMNYYRRINDGTTVYYQQISAVNKDYYVLQTEKPSDWASNYSNYYYKAEKEYKEVTGDKAPTWKKKKYYTKKTEYVVPSYNSVKPVYGAYAPHWGKYPRYTQISIQVAPKWKKATYYSIVQNYVAPEWASNTYYTKTKVTSPTWATNTYYTEVERMVAPEWKNSIFYRQYLDHYASMVEKGIEYLQKKLNSDTIDISLELENIYDINDVIGAKENVTGLSVWMPITKKIVKITDTTETVEYEVGE